MAAYYIFQSICIARCSTIHYQKINLSWGFSTPFELQRHPICLQNKIAGYIIQKGCSFSLNPARRYCLPRNNVPLFCNESQQCESCLKTLSERLPLMFSRLKFTKGIFESFSVEAMWATFNSFFLEEVHYKRVYWSNYQAPNIICNLVKYGKALCLSVGLIA